MKRTRYLSAAAKVGKEESRVLKPLPTFFERSVCGACNFNLAVIWLSQGEGDDVDSRFLCRKCFGDDYRDYPRFGWKLGGIRFKEVSGTYEWFRVRPGRIEMAAAGWMNSWDVVGSKGDPYVVSLRPDGITFGCSCPAWKFHKAPKKDCKHIEMLKTARGINPAVFTFTKEDAGKRPITQTVVEVKVQLTDGDFFNVRRKFRD